MKPVLHFRVFAVRHSQVGPRGEATSHCMSLPGGFDAGNVTRVMAAKVPNSSVSRRGVPCANGDLANHLGITSGLL